MTKNLLHQNQQAHHASSTSLHQTSYLSSNNQDSGSYDTEAPDTSGPENHNQQNNINKNSHKQRRNSAQKRRRRAQNAAYKGMGENDYASGLGSGTLRGAFSRLDSRILIPLLCRKVTREELIENRQQMRQFASKWYDEVRKEKSQMLYHNHHDLDTKDTFDSRIFESRSAGSDEIMNLLPLNLQNNKQQTNPNREVFQTSTLGESPNQVQSNSQFLDHNSSYVIGNHSPRGVGVNHGVIKHTSSFGVGVSSDKTNKNKKQQKETVITFSNKNNFSHVVNNVTKNNDQLDFDKEMKNKRRY